jgi:F0F1-type ATP synthase assembly protein I
MQQKKPKKQPKRAKSLSDYARYSGMAFQMITIILLGVFGGMQLDKRLKINFPLFTVVLSFLAVILAMYYGVKDFIRTKKD